MRDDVASTALVCPWWRRFVAISPQECVQMEMTSSIAALMMWTSKVMQDAMLVGRVVSNPKLQQKPAPSPLNVSAP